MNLPAEKLNDDLRQISNLAFQWKMSFNPDLNKQTQEVIFIRKIKSNIHPLLVFNNIIDFKLTFEEYLLRVFKKANETIGL